MADRIRIGVVGCGLVAQVMHLPYLRELDGLFEIGGVCDLSPSRVNAVGEMYGVARRTTDWQELLTWPLDVVMVLIAGSHAPVAHAAFDAGLHVFAEKPLALSVAEGRSMVEHAQRAGRILMTGYMKRYDPAYELLQGRMGELGEIRHARLVTQESPFEPYVAHYALHMANDVPAATLAVLGADDRARVRAAIGDVDALTARVYRDWILDSMVHELNAVRGLLGDPTSVSFARIRESGNHRRPPVRRRGVRGHLDGPARDGALPPILGVRRRRPAGGARAALAVPAKRADAAHVRGRRGWLARVERDCPHGRLRRGVQARAP